MVDVYLSPWASGATIAAAVFSILVGITVGLWALNKALSARFDKNAKDVSERFDKQDDEQERFRAEVHEIVESLQATDRDHDRRLTRVETRMDEHDKIHSRTWVAPDVAH